MTLNLANTETLRKNRPKVNPFSANLSRGPWTHQSYYVFFVFFIIQLKRLAVLEGTRTVLITLQLGKLSLTILGARGCAKGVEGGIEKTNRLEWLSGLLERAHQGISRNYHYFHQPQARRNQVMATMENYFLPTVLATKRSSEAAATCHPFHRFRW